MRTLALLATLLFASIAIASCPDAPIVRAIALKHHLDPKLALAIVEVESDCDATKVGSLGEVGIFQLRPDMHPGAKGNRVQHITTAIKYLSYVRNRCATNYANAWFVCYNQGPFRKTKLKQPKETTYYKKVMEAYGENSYTEKR